MSYASVFEDQFSAIAELHRIEAFRGAAPFDQIEDDFDHDFAASEFDDAFDAGFKNA